MSSEDPRDPIDERFAKLARPTEVFAGSLIGLSEGDAESAAMNAGFQVRVESRDGCSFPLTMDRRSTRINLTVERGAVVAVRVF